MTVSAAGIRTRTYWSADADYQVRLPSTEAYVEAFREKLDAAVAFALRTRDNVGVMVSGGLDSSAVTAVAGELLRCKGKRLQAIHYVKQGDDPRKAFLREHDESRYVRMLEAHAPHIDFHFVERNNEPLPPDEWQDLYDVHQVPLRGLPTRLNEGESSLLSDLGITSFTNGLGGNYVVSLEALPSHYMTELFWTLRWPTLWKETTGVRAVYGYGGRKLVRDVILDPVQSVLKREINMARQSHLDLLDPGFVERNGLADMLNRNAFSGPVHISPFRVKKRLAQMINGLIPQHILVSPSVIAPTYRVRSSAPMMNIRLNEFCLGVPVEQQIKDGEDRLLLRRSMSGLLPAPVRRRITRGFPTPSFWRNFLRFEDSFGAALGRVKHSPLVTHVFDRTKLEALYNRAYGARDVQAAHTFSDAMMVAQYLDWLDGQA